MGALFGLSGMVGFVAFLIALIVAAIKKKPKRNPLIGMAVCFALFIIGGIITANGGDAVKTNMQMQPSTKTAISSASAPKLGTHSQVIASSSATPSSTKSQPIYEDKLIRTWFIKKYDISYLKGMFYFDIKVENKTDRKILIYLDDSYVNDTTFTAISGGQMSVLPKKNSTCTFLGPYKGTDIDSADKIKKIGFKISITDENLNEIEKTKTLELNFK